MLEPLMLRIAGLDFSWSCSDEFEQLEIARVFRHHIIPGEQARPVHRVEMHTVWEPLRLPEDAVCRWKGYYMGRMKSAKEVEWYHSPSEGLDYYVLADDLWFTHCVSSALTRCSMLCRREADDRIAVPLINDMILLLLHTMLSIYGRYTIHSAGVCHNGEAHLFMGESGHGKSTLCNRLVEQGGGYMGDDLILLYRRPEDGRIMAGSVLFEAKLFPKNTKRYKDNVDLMELHGAVDTVFEAPVKRIYYIERTHRWRSWLSPLTPMDAIVRLIHASNNVRMQHSAELWQSTLQQAAEDIPYCTLHFGKIRMLGMSILDREI